MGREALVDGQEAAGFRVPITKEPSVNLERPGRPDAYTSMRALGETIHNAATPVIDRLLATLGRERSRELQEATRQDPDNWNRAVLEETETGIDAGLEGAEQLEREAEIIGHRVESRDEIIATLEAALRN